MLSTVSTHLYHVSAATPQNVTPYGHRTDVTVENLPVLNGMALSSLILNPKAIREPHWHPNANELGYCMKGKGLITIFSPGSEHQTFTIESGSLSFIPMGSIHHIENIGDGPLEMLLCFNHESPEELNLSSSVSVMPNHILGETFNLNPSFFAGLHHSIDPIFISKVDQTPKVLPNWSVSPNKFNVEEVNPQIQTKGGWVKMSNGYLMPTLQGMALYSLNLEKNGAREPHWHPNAHELNYLLSGTARITLFSPGGKVDTFDLNPGDMSFLPRGYFHHIENTSSEPARFAIFFNDPFPSDIGISGSLGAYSNQILGSVFKVPASYFDQMPKFQSDLFVVGGG